MDKFPNPSSSAQDSTEKNVGLVESRRENSGHVMEQQDSEDQLQLRDGEDNLSYKEAIVKLRARLGSSVCPKPEVKSKPIGASALDFFKDPEQVEEASL